MVGVTAVGVLFIIFMAMTGFILFSVFEFIRTRVIDFYFNYIHYTTKYLFVSHDIKSIIKEGENALIERVSCLTPMWADVWVKSYIDPDEPSLGFVIYKDILFHGNKLTHDWRWLTSKGAYGWVERRKVDQRPPKKPAEPVIPMFYASSPEAAADAEAILEQYRKDSGYEAVE